MPAEKPLARRSVLRAAALAALAGPVLGRPAQAQAQAAERPLPPNRPTAPPRHPSYGAIVGLL
ncbi:hypothetical protein RKD23_000823 [Streptomyces sp. SAI-170]|uniref:hypothetical protein n=1 Tax=Streptomyces sp. SAI-170 TaxID=3377729 RepID=UPI003C7E70B9